MINLHPQLQKDCVYIGHFPLCQLLLSKDANYPWLILVPNRNDMTEIYQLDPEDQMQLMIESSYLAEFLSSHFDADKINIGALGNLVPQLHIHHIARYKTDAAWPSPIWGQMKATQYTEQAMTATIEKLKHGLKQGFHFAADI